MKRALRDIKVNLAWDISEKAHNVKTNVLFIQKCSQNIVLCNNLVQPKLAEYTP